MEIKSKYKSSKRMDISLQRSKYYQIVMTVFYFAFGGYFMYLGFTLNEASQKKFSNQTLIFFGALLILFSIVKGMRAYSILKGEKKTFEDV